MTTYQYKATDDKGQIIEDMLKSANTTEAMEILESLGYKVESITPMEEEENPKFEEFIEETKTDPVEYRIEREQRFKDHIGTGEPFRITEVSVPNSLTRIKIDRSINSTPESGVSVTLIRDGDLRMDRQGWTALSKAVEAVFEEVESEA